jgi:hypothetical protein
MEHNILKMKDLSTSLGSVGTLRQATLLSLLALTAAGQNIPPSIFYSDIDSGPNTRGESNRGAYVTIYGKGFGASQLSSVVTIGGSAAASYAVWSDRKISFQLGPAAQTGNIVVTSSGGSSNGLPFTVRVGNIFFVSPTGSDSNSGSVTAPWGSVQHARDTMQAGDITYVRNGYVRDTQDDWDACFVIGGKSGAPGNPLALVVYPGETATLGSATACGNGVRTKGQGELYWTLAGFNLIGSGQAYAAYNPQHWRIVGNDMTCPNANGASGCFTFGPALDMKAYGNNVHDAGLIGASALYHGVYIADQSVTIDFGWNTVANVNGCRGVQFNSSTSYDEADILVHDNVIHDTVCDGVIMATVDPSIGNGVWIYNNIIYNAGMGPNPPDGGGAFFCLNLQGWNAGPGTNGVFEVYDNTFYNCGTNPNPPYSNAVGAFTMNGPNPNKTAHLRNNLIYEPNLTYMEVDSGSGLCGLSGSCPRVWGSNNLFYGNGLGPAYPSLSASLNSNPLLTDVTYANFHPLSGSPASYGGTAVPDNFDFDGVPLPQGSGFPIGALTLPGGGSGTLTGTISLTPLSAALTGGSTLQFAATVLGLLDTSVKWSINPQVGTISNSGLYTAPAVISGSQAVTVTATSNALLTLSASALITLTPVGIAVSPGSVTLSANGLQQFSAMVTSSSNAGVTWTMSPMVGWLSTSGLYTAPSVINSAQAVTVKATSVSDPTKSAGATVNLNPIVGVSVAPGFVTLTQGGSQQFAATVAGSSNTGVTWSLSPLVGSISASGLYTAPSTISSSQTIIVQATSAADPTKSATAAVNLTPQVSVFVTPDSATVGESGTSPTTVKVSWTAASPDPTDWIALSSPGAPAWWRIADQSGAGAGSGFFTVTIPPQGIFEARYFSSGSYTLLAKSAPSAIGVNGYSLSPSSSSASAGSTLAVGFKASPGQTSSDWVGLFPVGGPSDQPVAWTYPMGASSGALQFNLPATPGNYELRYIRGANASYSYVTMAQASITVQ